MHTFLDFDFLKTLPIGQCRNGFAEIMKISHAAEKQTWDLLVKYGPQLVESGFGRKENGSAELKEAADTICRRAIFKMLELESGNLHEVSRSPCRREATPEANPLTGRSGWIVLSPPDTGSAPRWSSRPSRRCATATPSPST